MKKLMAAACAVLISSVVLANTNIITALKPFAPNISEKNIKPSPIAGIKMVMMGMDILYISADGRYAIKGDLIDLVNAKNINDEQKKTTAKQMLSEVSANEKITFKADHEKYIVNVFTDIDCPYCRKLHKDIQALNLLGITVNYLAFPRAGLQSKSYDKAVAVWCANDPQTAMTHAKNNQTLKMTNCKNPVQQQFELAAALNVLGTPTIFLENGVNIPGYLPPEQLLGVIKKHGSVL